MANSSFAKTPQPPYYAVIFTSQRVADKDSDYGKTADQMVELAIQQVGFLGFESARNESGIGITVSYWESEEAIKNWKNNTDHAIARARGKKEWYEHFEVRIAKVERAYGKAK